MVPTAWDHHPWHCSDSSLRTEQSPHSSTPLPTKVRDLRTDACNINSGTNRHICIWHCRYKSCVFKVCNCIMCICIHGNTLFVVTLFVSDMKHAIKVTIACTFTHKIAWFSSLSLGKKYLAATLRAFSPHVGFPHRMFVVGIMNDDVIAMNGLHGPRVYRYPWEWAIADGIYRRLPRTHIPFRKPRSVLSTCWFNITGSKTQSFDVITFIDTDIVI